MVKSTSTHTSITTAIPFFMHLRTLLKQSVQGGWQVDTGVSLWSILIHTKSAFSNRWHKADGNCPVFVSPKPWLQSQKHTRKIFPGPSHRSVLSLQRIENLTWVLGKSMILIVNWKTHKLTLVFLLSVKLTIRPVEKREKPAKDRNARPVVKKYIAHDFVAELELEVSCSLKWCLTLPNPIWYYL